MNEIKTSCASTDQQITIWESVDWNKCEAKVKKLQTRIVKAQKDSRHNKVKAFQWIFIHSFYAKALVIKQVTSNKGSDTAGVDGVTWSTHLSKSKAISDLKQRGYTPQPLKRVHIKKSNGKLRPLGIPTMKDRAMQALYLLALEAISETTADKSSFGFRKHRSTKDAISQCSLHLSPDYQCKWILEGDIKGCFDHISHKWLINNIPMDKIMLRKWLKCGFVFNKQFFPTKEGIPQGGIISPTLANMTLDGLQGLLAKRFKAINTRKMYYNPKVYLVRYADDFIITCENRETLENEIKLMVKEFLADRGLTLSEEKTKITHIDDGFDFLGFNIRKYKGNLLITPSKDKVKKLYGKIKEIVERNKSAKQEILIRLLTPVIDGWGNYYRNCVASETFNKLDHMIVRKLWRWSFRRHLKKGKRWIKQRYFHSVDGNNWIFGTQLEEENAGQLFSLKRLCDKKIIKHIKICNDSNPYDPQWEVYYKKRHTQQMLEHFNGNRTILRTWENQMQRCPVCGEPLSDKTTWTLTHKMINGKKVKYLTHNKCCKITDTNKWKLL